jgi:hypothetical protein
LVEKWNETANSQEGILIALLNNYLLSQETLRTDMSDLADLNDQLNATALQHDSAGLVNYVDMLIKTAQANKMSVDYLMQLNTARNTLKLLSELKKNNRQIGQDLVILVQVLDDVRKEMDRRMKLSMNDRIDEEKKASSLYNNLRQQLPLDLKKKVPAATSDGALYSVNLKAVVELVRVILKDGGVLAALASQAVS